MAPTRPVWSGALTELMRTGTFGLGFVVAAIAAGLLMTWLLYPSPLLPGHAEVPQLRGLPYQQAVEELKKIKNASLVIVTATVPATGARR